MKSELLYEDRLVCVARQDHCGIREDISILEFLELEHLVVEREGRQEGFNAQITEFKHRPRMVLQIPHFMSVPRLVSSSSMVSIVPLSLAALFAGSYSLRIFDSPITLPNVDVKQFWHRRVDNDPAVRWLRGVVSSQLRGHVPAG